MASTNFIVSNISGFAKFEYNDANLVIYAGNNLAMSIRNDRWIEVNNIDTQRLENNLELPDYHNLVIDYTNLIDKRGTTTPEQYIELLISSGDLAAQFGSGGTGSDVNIVSQSAGLALESKQDIGNTSLSSIDSKVATSANQETTNTTLSSIDSKIATDATISAFEKKTLQYLSNIAELLSINNELLKAIAE